MERYTGKNSRAIFWIDMMWMNPISGEKSKDGKYIRREDSSGGAGGAV